MTVKLQRFVRRVDSPIGVLTIVANETGLTEIRFPSNKLLTEPGTKQSCHLVEEAAAQLHAYFDGRLNTFSLPLCPAGTDFQQAVWQQLRAVAYGATASYGEIAAAIGRPKASRAVGAASGRNPIPIVVPCHRIIGSNGALTGFSGGLEIKRWLLAHEQGGGQRYKF